MDRVQDALFSIPSLVAQAADYIDLLKFIASSTEMDCDDPRFIAAFDFGARAVRSISQTEGKTILEVFDLIDSEDNIGKVATFAQK